MGLLRLDDRLHYGIDLGPQIPVLGIAQGFGVGRIDFRAREIGARRQQQAESAAPQHRTEDMPIGARLQREGHGQGPMLVLTGSGRTAPGRGGHAGGSGLNASSFGTKPFGDTWMK
jgi:hypothetical protein